MTKLILPLLVFAFGGYNSYEQFQDPAFVTTLKSLATSYGAMGAGGLLGLNAYRAELVNLVKGFFGKKETKVPAEGIFSPAEFEIKDLECLVHLRNRVKAIHSEAGIEAVNTLNSVLFNGVQEGK